VNKLKVKPVLARRTLVNNAIFVGNVVFAILLCLFLVWAVVRRAPYYSNLIGFDLNVRLSLCVIFILLSVQFFVFLYRLGLNKRVGFWQVVVLLILLFFAPYIPLDFIRWYEQKKESLREVVFQKELVVPPVSRDDGSVVYYVNKGIINFEDGGWVYIDAHAEKEEVKRKDQFSLDFALAIDDKGTIYRLDHRIFGVLEIHSGSKGGIPDIHHFLQLGNWEKEK
jgi:hypothetical protein